MRHCDPVTMDHIIELRKRVALLEKQLENALVWVTAKQREEAVARDVLKEMRQDAEIERLRGMLIFALDGLDEYWVTFPEGVELVNQIKALQQKEKE